MSVPQIWLRSAIEAAAGCNAYPKDAPLGIDPPFVVYERSATSRPQLLSDTLDDPAEGTALPPTAMFTVQVYADDYLEAWAKSDAIASGLHGFAGTADGVNVESCLVQDEKDGEPFVFEGREAVTYIVEMLLEIRWS